MNIHKQNTVGEIVRQNFKTATIFESKGIDFCCGGNITLEEACTAENLNIDDFIQELQQELHVADSESTYLDSLPVTALCDYIVNRHHAFVRKQIPDIRQKMEKLCRVYGANHPELFEVQAEFNQAAINLTQHLKQEEEKYFPYISRLENRNLPKSDDMITIEQLRKEHQAEGDRFFRIAHLTKNYLVPADACATYRVTYELLKEFEQDLHQHVHLENNMLFIKAETLENNNQVTDITQTLKDEHQNILRVMRLAEQQCQIIEKGEQTDVDFFTKLFDFIAVYVDKFHHGKEEDILFEAMLNNEEHLHCNPVPVMLYEHDSGRGFLKEMCEALAENKPEELCLATRGYIDLLSNHIYKEDNVLYPMAEEAIGAAEKKSINDRYQQAEKRINAAFDIDNLTKFGQ